MRNKRKYKIDKTPKKRLKNPESQKIKRIEKEINLTVHTTKENEKKPDKIYDLWENSSKLTSLIKLEPLKYPRVVIPHPGQSYNPNQKDLKNLLQNIVDNNRSKLVEEEKVPLNIELEEQKFIAIESDNEEEKKGGFKISNNPPVDATDRLPRRIRNKKVNKLLNISIIASSTH